MDVKALYPSITKDWVKKILKVQMINTKVKIEEVDWTETALYLAISYDPEELEEEGLTEVVHKRRYTQGQKHHLNKSSEWPQRKSKRREKLDRTNQDPKPR